MTLEDTNCIFFIIKKQTQMVHSHDDKFLMLFFFFFFTFLKEIENVWARRERHDPGLKNLRFCEKV